MFKQRDPDYLRIRMVERLVRKGYIRSEHVRRAMLSVPRDKFVNQAPSRAYSDRPLPIGFGQTISAPHMVAYILESLELRAGLKVLEVGTGSGYHAAVCQKALDFLGGGQVYSIEIVEGLYHAALRNLEKVGLSSVRVFLGDGFEGLPAFAPFDRIYVTAATPEKPQPLYSQLSDQGILIYPFGLPNQTQRLIKVKKTDGSFREEVILEVAFVPLRRRGERGQP